MFWSELAAVLPQLKFPRNIDGGRKREDRKFKLHFFSDASQKAYATVAFLRIETVGGIQVHLIQSKSRVAPVQKVTIPRLELLSCVISSRLAVSVKEALNFNDVPSFYWTDSTTALSWIQRYDDWGTFVGNRVKEICRLTRAEQWRHVPGFSNPADLPSRGVSPTKFKELRWREGPAWLKLEEKKWPKSEESADDTIVNQERRRGITTLLTTSISRPWYLPFNSYHRNLTVMSFVCRFVDKLMRRTTETRRTSSPEEIKKFVSSNWSKQKPLTKIRK